MREIARQIERLPQFVQITDALDTGRQPVLCSGLSPIHKAQVIHALSTLREQGAVVITPDEQTAARLCEELNLLEGETVAWQYPEREFTLRPVEGVSHEYEHARLSVLTRLLSGRAGIAVASVAAALQLTLPPQKLRDSLHVVRAGQALPQQELVAMLLWAGYQRAEQVEGISQFAVRGGIVDFYPPDLAWPVRIEYWGDEVDTIAAFSIESQRREDSLKQVTITPAQEVLYLPDQLAELLEAHLETLSKKQLEQGGEPLRRDIARLREGRTLGAADRYLPLLYRERSTLLSYLGGRLLCVCEGTAVKEAAQHQRFSLDEEIKTLLEEGVLTRGCERLCEDYAVLWDCYDRLPTLLLDSFPRSYPGIRIAELAEFKANTLSVWSGEIATLLEELEHYLAESYCCMVLAGTARGAAALADDLRGHGIAVRYTKDRGEFERGCVLVCEGGLSSGAEYPQLGLAILTYGRAAHIVTKKKKRTVPKGSRAIKDIADLSVGDYVVHSAHGIGVFEGIVKKEVQGVIKDYIKIRYAGTDMLFVPVTQLDLVTKYIGGKEDAQIKLNKLNSQEWSKTRQRVKKAVSDMAKELIALYAKRLQAKGHPFDEDTEWQKDFEQKFEYDETDDQLRCINEIKGDMERAVPMDRLLCGDVGFGKTEVALRAVFKCVMSGKQCAVMVPTTILAWQHYQTFLRRLEGFPMRVELLSRFRTPKQQKEILRKLASGEIDIVVGTHKLVQKDVEFSDLGLCVIDEEQRFGVAHKERFKELRASVDVLTLSATPIPRTLNMAMSGIRDMSVIEEAPQDRHPVQTYVLEYDDAIIMEAIRRELRRGGQVFYLHNRVESIGHCAARLQEALPDARIQTAHGRMGEEELSQVWKALVEREIDILVCTTIIETGVDVPNCNTLVIEDADRMGLSQLYQLRGRVGRSGRRAYAYFTFRRGRVLTEVGEKRLAAIREFTSFGSGFRIAMRDLEIRGAGDILGSQQHGQMESVGYDLYLKLLSDAIAEEKGEAPKAGVECLIDLQIGAHIPEDYIGSLSQRVDIYKKIACVYTQDDYLDTMDELIDRFGEPPDAVRGLLDVALVRNSAAAHGIVEITQRGQSLLLYPEVMDMEKTVAMVQRMRGRIMVSAGTRPYLSVKLLRGQPPLEAIREVLGVMD